MRICVYAVGRMRGSHWQPLAADYLARIVRYAKCEVVELKDDAELVRAAPRADVVVALEVQGNRLNSTQFAQKFALWARCGQGRVAFIVGGCEGIPRSISRCTDYQLSLSDMTLPHRLARVFLLEQIYRAQTLLRGEPYAREF